MTAAQVAHLEIEVDDVRERLAGLEAKVDGHERADQQRHEELRAGQARVETGLQRLLLAQLGVVALGMVLMAGLVGVALDLDVPSLGGLTVGVAEASAP